MLTAKQKTKPWNAFEKNLSADIELSRTQLSKIIQFGGFLSSMLPKIAVPLMKVVAPLAKNILAPLGITAAESAIDAGIQKKINGSGTITVIISNEEMNDIIKVVQTLEDLISYWKALLKQLKMKQKNKKVRFLGMLLGTLGASLLGTILAGEGIVRAGNKKNKENKS